MHPRHPGLLHLPAKQYHADQSIGHSGILKMLKSPAHLRETLDHPPPPTPAMAFGSAVPPYVLEPDRFSEEFVVAEKFDRRTKEGKEAAARFEEATQGKTLIPPEDLATLGRMRAAVLAHQGAARLLEQGEAELSAFWSDPATGIACRCRPDWFNETAIVDLKSCLDASSRGFSRAIANLGYDVQAAFYVDELGRVTGRSYLSLRRRREGATACRRGVSGRSGNHRDWSQEVPGRAAALEVVPGIRHLAGVPAGGRGRTDLPAALGRQRRSLRVRRRLSGPFL
ncbi:MAG: PD-(D/E)XK nuclease-like domain-containing protein [Candidatus Accumulibacter sp.]|uniref:PD-(D/E)XK nuclease-like domain-containing protein n=1 Tax=Candidatus Accumulibacter proximus TaxID=2954385 RepID=A0A935UJC5_9PROT|nr:PD-(D/E)XK nuclease-like domain-containing protein [Candidatus Accumulibacter proximus]